MCKIIPTISPYVAARPKLASMQRCRTLDSPVPVSARPGMRRPGERSSSAGCELGSRVGQLGSASSALGSANLLLAAGRAGIAPSSTGSNILIIETIAPFRCSFSTQEIDQKLPAVMNYTERSARLRTQALERLHARKPPVDLARH